MKKGIKCLILLILGLLFFIPSAYAVKVDKDDILYNSYVIGSYLYTSDENDIYDTTGLETIYNENDGLFTKEIMLAATSISKSEYAEMVIYYKDFWDDWADALSGDYIYSVDSFDITHVNGICIDPSCSGNTYNVTLKYNDGVTSDVTKTLVYKEVFDEPVTPTKLGHKFVCWTLENTDDCYDFKTPVEEDLVLEASWSAYNYKITYKDTVSQQTKIVECNFTAGNECTYHDFTDYFVLKEGYTFNGWSLAESGEKVYTSDASFKSLFGDTTEFTLYSIFNSSDYTISYNLNGGSFTTLQSPTTVYDPSNLTYDISTPSRVGYQFSGWEVTKGDAEVNNSVITINAVSNIEITANWTANTYNVVYSGTNLNTTTCKYDSDCILDLSKITVPDGKRIKSITATVGGTSYSIGTKVKNLTTANGDNVPVTVTFEDIKYNISYELNGGTVSGNPDDALINTGVSLNIPTKTGYTFAGWSVSSGKADVSNNSLKITSPENVKLTANWTANTYKLVYNNTDYATCTYDQTCEVKDLDTSVVPAGKEFLRWKDKSGKLIGSSVYNYTTSGVVEISPVYTLITYPIVYSYNGGTIVSENAVSYDVDNMSIMLSNPTKAGYTFDRWNVETSNASVTGDTLTINKVGEVRLTAIWKANTYKLVYNEGDIEQQSCTYDSSCTVSSVKPVKEGYIFKGWKYNESYMFDSNANINLITDNDATINLEAIWIEEKADVYSINYVLNGGTFENTPIVTFTKADNDVLLSVPTKLGYTFNGWYDNSEFTGSEVSSVNASLKKNVTLYAKWTANTYDVVLYKDVNGTEVLDTKKCTYDVTCSLGDNSLKFDGYTLLGWSKNKGGNVFYGDNLDLINLTDNGTFNLYPVLEVNTHVVSYYLDGATFTDESNVSYTFNNLTGFSLPTVTKAGYTFNGWKTSDGTKVNEGQTDISDDVVLIPDFVEATTYKVNFYPSFDTEQTMESVVCTFGERCELPDNTFTRVEYNFVKFNVINDYDEYGRIVPFPYNSTDNTIIYTYDYAKKYNRFEVDLYAGWEEKTSYTVTYTCYYNMWSQCPSGTLSVYEGNLITGLPESFGGYDGYENRDVSITKWKISGTDTVIDLDTYTVNGNITIEAAGFN